MASDRRNDGRARDVDDEEPGRLEQHLTSRATWTRLLFMIVMTILYSVSRIVVGAVVILQFLCVLFSGKTNERLTETGQSLAAYTYQVVRYLTFNTERRPFPFDMDWPRPNAPVE